MGEKKWSSYKMDVILKKGGEIVIEKVNEKKGSSYLFFKWNN
jgi:hypothetical protein